MVDGEQSGGTRPAWETLPDGVATSWALQADL